MDGDRLFRQESGRLVAALTRIFGMHNLALAEDVVQDAFCRALEVWKFRGVPDDPAAWLSTTAKNRALDVLRRERTARTYAPELGRLLESEWTLKATLNELLNAHAIKDDSLRMMFTCCHPSIPRSAQAALILNVLCGFTVGEIAGAFFNSGAAVEKRLTRAKKALAGVDGFFDLTADSVAARLPVVQRALYQLFNEGYHGAGVTSTVRIHLVREAMRLGALLHDHPQTRTPSSSALYALMCLHAARLPARTDGCGHLTALAEQDRSLFDADLIAQGGDLLDEAATGAVMCEYHIEAAIAWVHARAKHADETDWQRIVEYYDLLLAMRPSPVVALNRAIALAQQHGPERGLREISSIAGRKTLADYPFCFAAIGELELRRGRSDRAAENFRAALERARNPGERDFFARRLKAM